MQRVFKKLLRYECSFVLELVSKSIKMYVLYKQNVVSQVVYLYYKTVVTLWMALVAKTILGLLGGRCGVIQPLIHNILNVLLCHTIKSLSKICFPVHKILTH